MNHTVNLMSTWLSRIFLSLFFVATLLLVGCGDDPAPVNEEEVITTLTMTLTPVGEGSVVTLRFFDEDGDGPIAPVYTYSTPGGTSTQSAVLSSNTVYVATIDLLNETKTPAESITEEIEEEADEHQFFFIVAPQALATNLFVVYADTEDDYMNNGSENPVGLSNVLTTIDPATGTLTVVLVHEPNKDAAGAAEGLYNETLVGGEEDIRVTFNVAVQ